MIRPDGSSLKEITFSRGFDGDPAWNDDSSRIAFETTRNGRFDIYSVKADGSDQVRLTTSAADDADPAWSPDGTKIAFMSDRTGRRQVWVMNADGSGQTQLTSAENIGGENPELVAERPHDRLRLGPRRRRQPRHLGDEAGRFGAGAADRQPGARRASVLLAERKLIVFVSDRTAKDNREFFQMTANGGSQRRLFADPRQWDMSPDWGSVAAAGALHDRRHDQRGHDRRDARAAT